MGVLAVCAAAIASCGEDRFAAPVIPTRVRTGPVESGPARSRHETPAAVPTWTLPPGAVAGSPAAADLAGAGGTVGPMAGPPAGGPGSGIPVPTAVSVALPAGGAAPAPDPAIVAMMAQVDAGRMMADVQRLASFGTRHALSDAQSPSNGIGAARAWLLGRFDRLASEGAQTGPSPTSRSQVLVEYEGFPLDFGGRRTEQGNVVTTLTGIGLRKRLVYAVAHYDSRGADPADGVAAAPGADDNASGVAALLELARVMSGRQWDATVRFLAFAAHETGTQGSREHARRARDMALPIEAVLDFDVIGGPRTETGPVAVVESADGPAGSHRQWARGIAAIARRYGNFEVLPMHGEPPEGHPGDFRRFVEHGFPAARVREAAGGPSALHGAGDTPARVDPEALAEVTRLGLAVLANLALAPPSPSEAPTVGAAEGRPNALRVSWQAVDDESVSGYWLGVRAVDAPFYEDLVWVGGATDHTLPYEGVLPVAIAVAAGDVLGHVGMFGPEGRYPSGE